MWWKLLRPPKWLLINGCGFYIADQISASRQFEQVWCCVYVLLASLSRCDVAFWRSLSSLINSPDMTSHVIVDPKGSVALQRKP